MHGSQQKILIFLITNFICLQNVIESMPIKQKTHHNDSSVVYRRYIRKRPSFYEGDIYMEEVHEIFETRRRPPQFGVFNDNEIDQIIRCDFEPHLKECESLQKKEQNQNPVLPPLPTKQITSTTTTSSATSKTPLKSIPVPNLPTLQPYKPTHALDLNPPEINDIDSIPTLPPDSEEYDENLADYEEETTDKYPEITENYNQNKEVNEVDEEDGDDF